MTGIRLAASIGVTLCALQLGASAALAESIPLPTKAPAPKDYSKPAPPQSPTPTQSTVPPPPAASSSPSLSGAIMDTLGKIPNPFASHQSTDLSLFDAKQRALVNRVSNYLTSVQTLTGNFVQIGPDGRRSTGHLFLVKPGKVRFEYDPPATIDIVADGSQVAVRDHGPLNSNDVYPLSQTPLRFLLADRIDLLQDTNVVGVTVDDVFVSVIIEEKQPFVGTNRLTMMFDAKDFKLKQWTITDVQGFDTTIAVSNLDTTKRIDPNLFRLEVTRLVQ